MDNISLFAYLLGTFVGLIIIAAIFYWILGMSKVLRNSDKQYFMLRSMARKLGVEEDTIERIDRWPEKDRNWINEPGYSLTERDTSLK